MWEEGVSCQRFFRTGKWQHWFVVQGGERNADITRKDEWLRRGEQMLAEFQCQVVEHAQQNKIDPAGHRYVANAWLDRTGWAPHLSRYNAGELEEFVRWPQREDGKEEGRAE